MTKARLTKKEANRLQELQEARMQLCDAGRWTRDSYNMCAAQVECEDEIRRLRAKRDNRIWL
jgi:hypothetical protein